MICVARKARRVSSKLWHGRKDDEYLGLWDTFLPSAFWPSAARNLSIRKKLAKPREPEASYANGTLPGEPNVILKATK